MYAPEHSKCNGLSRRRFLKDSVLVGTGIVGGLALGANDTRQSTIATQLTDLGLRDFIPTYQILNRLNHKYGWPIYSNGNGHFYSDLTQLTERTSLNQTLIPIFKEGWETGFSEREEMAKRKVKILEIDTSLTDDDSENVRDRLLTFSGAMPGLTITFPSRVLMVPKGGYYAGNRIALRTLGTNAESDLEGFFVVTMHEGTHALEYNWKAVKPYVSRRDFLSYFELKLQSIERILNHLYAPGWVPGRINAISSALSGIADRSDEQLAFEKLLELDDLTKQNEVLASIHNIGEDVPKIQLAEQTIQSFGINLDDYRYLDITGSPRDRDSDLQYDRFLRINYILGEIMLSVWEQNGELSDKKRGIIQNSDLAYFMPARMAGELDHFFVGPPQTWDQKIPSELSKHSLAGASDWLMLPDYLIQMARLKGFSSLDDMELYFVTPFQNIRNRLNLVYNN